MILDSSAERRWSQPVYGSGYHVKFTVKPVEITESVGASIGIQSAKTSQVLKKFDVCAVDGSLDSSYAMVSLAG